MKRWGQISGEVDYKSVAEQVYLATDTGKVMKDMGLTDRTDPSTIMLAKLTIELAKQGEFTAASLRARVLKEMRPKGRPN